MFKVSHEVPLDLLDKSRDFNDYDYALVHLFNEKFGFRYYSFFSESLRRGRKVILDNSAFELGEPMEVEEYLEWILALEPTEFVLPDFRNDSEATIKAALDWDYKKTASMKSIGVVHGSNFREYCDCYSELNKTVDKIAFSVESFFEKKAENLNISLAQARVLVLKEMEDLNIIDKSKPHHILGCLHPLEYRNYSTAEWIETVDTSNPIVHGIVFGRYPDGSMKDYKKPSDKLADMMEMKIDDTTLQNILYNVKKFKYSSTKWNTATPDITKKYKLYSTGIKSFLKEPGEGYTEKWSEAYAYTEDELKEYDFYNQMVSGLAHKDECDVIAILTQVQYFSMADSKMNYILLNHETKKYSSKSSKDINNILNATIFKDIKDFEEFGIYDDLIIPTDSELNKTFFENLKSRSLSTSESEEDSSKAPERYSSRLVDGKDVIDLCKHWKLNFNEGNILKYLLRKKGEDISDLKKIIDYAQRELKHLEDQ